MPDPCAKCGGSGHILVDDLHVRQCLCSFVKDMKAHMGLEIAAAPVLDVSPLLVLGGDDLTEECLFIKSTWWDLLPHLKWVLFHKGLRFRYRITTDEKLVTIFLGKEAYNARARGKRDETETFNSLADLIGEDFNLVIVRLGYLGYPNKAAPGVLKEALMLRETMGRPTWLIESPDSIWGEGHRSYNQEVGDYVLERFREVAIKGQDLQGTAAPDGDDVSLDDAPIQPVERTSDRRQGPSVFQEVRVQDDLPDLSAVMGKPKPKGYSKKRRGGGSTGGGLSSPEGMGA